MGSQCHHLAQGGSLTCGTRVLLVVCDKRELHPLQTDGRFVVGPAGTLEGTVVIHAMTLKIVLTDL